MRLHDKNPKSMRVIGDAACEGLDPGNASSLSDGRPHVSVTLRRLRLYHGGVPGLLPGETLLPPLVTGVRSCADHDAEHSRSDRVYLTTDPAEAAAYAALTAPGGHGDVYEAKPLDTLEPDPPDVAGTGSYATRAAAVLAVVRRCVPPEEAIARMRTFLLTLDATSAETGNRRSDSADGDEVTFLVLPRHIE